MHVTTPSGWREEHVGHDGWVNDVDLCVIIRAIVPESLLHPHQGRGRSNRNGLAVAHGVRALSDMIIRDLDVPPGLLVEDDRSLRPLNILEPLNAKISQACGKAAG